MGAREISTESKTSKFSRSTFTASALACTFAAELVAEASRARELLGWTPRCSQLATIVEDAARSRR